MFERGSLVVEMAMGITLGSNRVKAEVVERGLCTNTVISSLAPLSHEY